MATMQDYDPFGFGRTFRPAPVSGETHPPVRLVEEADLAAERRTPLWLRVLAGSLALAFLANLLLVTLMTAGAFSPLIHAGDGRRLNAAQPGR